jgi:hypothetical protein
VARAARGTTEKSTAPPKKPKKNKEKVDGHRQGWTSNATFVAGTVAIAAAGYFYISTNSISCEGDGVMIKNGA